MQEFAKNPLTTVIEYKKYRFSSLANAIAIISNAKAIQLLIKFRLTDKTQQHNDEEDTAIVRKATAKVEARYHNAEEAWDIEENSYSFKVINCVVS